MNLGALPVPIMTRYIQQGNIQIKYPQVYGLRNNHVERKINHEIIKTMDQLNRKQGLFDHPLTEITGIYEIKNNQRNVLSIDMSNYAFSGGAHGLTINTGLNFDVKTGNNVPLASLLKENSNYILRLSKMVKQQIEDREIVTLGAFNQIKLDQEYYIADKCLVIYFQLYEITPYAFGFPYFPISIYSIEDIIDENSILARML